MQPVAGRIIFSEQVSVPCVLIRFVHIFTTSCHRQITPHRPSENRISEVQGEHHDRSRITQRAVVLWCCAQPARPTTACASPRHSDSLEPTASKAPKHSKSLFRCSPPICVRSLGLRGPRSGSDERTARRVRPTPSRPLHPHPWPSSQTSSRPCPDHASAGHARIASAQPSTSSALQHNRALFAIGHSGLRGERGYITP